ncbi:hypothetical protein H2203_003320 [Taxawa tesnikishii (nom. ined.)]|nr:hypothetical protein H2203_003320 [Dothideales sp. JES 119]
MLAYNMSALYPNATSDVPLFNITFDVDFRVPEEAAMYGDGVAYSRIIMDILYTDAIDTNSPDDGYSNRTIAKTDKSYDCPGTLVQQRCYLRPAVITYPVTYRQSHDVNAVSGMSLGVNTSSYNNFDGNNWAGLYNYTQKQQDGFKILRHNDVYEEHNTVASPTDTRLGGILLGLETYLTGTAEMWFDDIAGFSVRQSGQAASMLQTMPEAVQCGYSYSDPLTYLVQSINQIMLLISINPTYYVDVDDDTDSHEAFQPILTNYTAIVYRNNTHYVTKRPFMWGAFASMLACVLCVLPTYYGYWQLGRKVTLGPFEIANAFRAPVLEHSRGSNAEVGNLLKEVGGKRSSMER